MGLLLLSPPHLDFERCGHGGIGEMLGNASGGGDVREGASYEGKHGTLSVALVGCSRVYVEIYFMPKKVVFFTDPFSIRLPP